MKALKSEKPLILNEMFEQVGLQQVSRANLQFAPSWVLDEALASEHSSNWADAYEEVDERYVPWNANVVTSHVVYKVKTDEERDRKLKARIVPHGNEEDDKDSVRKDSSNAQLSIVRLPLSLFTFLFFSIKTVDIKGAYLQSGPIKRDTYMRPSSGWSSKTEYRKGTLWKLTKLPYGIVDAGRQWMLTVEEWMLSTAGMVRVFGVSQLFVKQNNKGSIILLVAKLSDDFLVAGKLGGIDDFTRDLQARFIVGKIVDGPVYTFGGCDITHYEQCPFEDRCILEKD